MCSLWRSNASIRSALAVRGNPLKSIVSSAIPSAVLHAARSDADNSRRVAVAVDGGGAVVVVVVVVVVVACSPVVVVSEHAMRVSMRVSMRIAVSGLIEDPPRMVMRAVEKREECRSSPPVRRWGVLTAPVREVLVLLGGSGRRRKRWRRPPRGRSVSRSVGGDGVALVVRGIHAVGVSGTGGSARRGGREVGEV